jgi:hypothetical protein
MESVALVIAVEGSQQVQDTLFKSYGGASPGFPVEIDGVGELHPAFLNESRTRGRWWRPMAGNPGRPVFFGPRTPTAHRGGLGERGASV